MNYFGLNKFAHDQADKVGVLLINLGTPDTTSVTSVRSFLKEFLSDPRVVEMPRLLWWLILNVIILRIRPAKSSRNYKKIWMDEGSPLLVHTQNQAKKIADKLSKKHGDNVVVDFAMRYGNPSISEKLKKMQLMGVRKLIVLPLYPQYSCSTTGSVFDEVAKELQSFRWIPELRFINEYHDFPAYIEACVNQIKQHWSDHGKPEKLLLSFHGTPTRYLTSGDPYFCHCQKTSRLISEQLESEGVPVLLSFQSRFGREPWLEPYTDAILKRLASENVESVQIFCPGFSADCLETLEEVAMENKELFISAGGKSYGFIPSLNAGDGHISALTQLLSHQLQEIGRAHV